MTRPTNRAWRNCLVACTGILAGNAYYYGLRNDQLSMLIFIGLAAIYGYMALCTHDGVTAFPFLDRRR